LEKDFGNPSATVPHLARAGAREMAHANTNGKGSSEGGTGGGQLDRVQRFMDRYADLHEHYIGVAYLGNPVQDYQQAQSLVGAFDDEMLEKLVVYWLNDRDEFATSSTRTLAKLRSRASKYAEELKALKLA
jgi:hypothetical protein